MSWVATVMTMSTTRHLKGTTSTAISITTTTLTTWSLPSMLTHHNLTLTHLRVEVPVITTEGTTLPTTTVTTPWRPRIIST